MSEGPNPKKIGVGFRIFCIFKFGFGFSGMDLGLDSGFCGSKPKSIPENPKNPKNLKSKRDPKTKFFSGSYSVFNFKFFGFSSWDSGLHL